MIVAALVIVLLSAITYVTIQSNHQAESEDQDLRSQLASSETTAGSDTALTEDQELNSQDTSSRDLVSYHPSPLSFPVIETTDVDSSPSIAEITTPSVDTTDDPGSQTPAPSPETTELQTYTNDQIGFAFDYPSSWDIDSFVVPKGTIKEQEGRYHLVANESDITVFTISKDGYELRLAAPTEVNPDAPPTCSATGPILDPQEYAWKTVFNRQSFRPAIETGNVPHFGDPSWPYPLNVLFRRFPGERTEKWPLADTDESFVGLFCLKWPDGDQSILFTSITYYSASFTKENITQGAIDAAILKEMDAIVGSLRRSPS